MYNNVQQSVNWFYLQSVSKHHNVLSLACRVSNILFTVIYCTFVFQDSKTNHSTETKEISKLLYYSTKVICTRYFKGRRDYEAERTIALSTPTINKQLMFAKDGAGCH